MNIIFYIIFITILHVSIMLYNLYFFQKYGIKNNLQNLINFNIKNYLYFILYNFLIIKINL